MGFGIGCLVLVVLAVALIGIGYQKFFKPFLESMERLEKVQQETKVQLEELRLMDQRYCSDHLADPATALLRDRDLERYIQVRDALEPFMAELSGIEERMMGRFDTVVEGDEPNVGAVMGMAFGTIRDLPAFLEARLRLLKEAWAVLYPRDLCPRDLATLAEIIEWRYLERSEALHLGLGPEKRKALFEKRMELRFAELSLKLGSMEDMQANQAELTRMRRNVEELREKIAAFEQEAGRNTGLHPETRALLERWRPRVEGLGPAGLRWAGTLTEEGDPGMFGAAAGSGGQPAEAWPGSD